MFRKIAKALQNPSGKRDPVDSSRFDDPIAKQTYWTPVEKGGTNFRTHKLVKINPDRLEFRPVILAGLFYLFLILIGLGALVIVPASMLGSGMSFWLGALIATVVGFGSIIAGAYKLYCVTAPIVFDRRTGFFWKGRGTPGGQPPPKAFAELGQIYALQLISEHCKGDEDSYYSYELNLVLEDGTRINILDHGNQREIQQDAQMLGAFLEKPVWDAT